MNRNPKQQHIKKMRNCISSISSNVGFTKNNFMSISLSSSSSLGSLLSTISYSNRCININKNTQNSFKSNTTTNFESKYPFIIRKSFISLSPSHLSSFLTTKLYHNHHLSNPYRYSLSSSLLSLIPSLKSTQTIISNTTRKRAFATSLITKNNKNYYQILNVKPTSTKKEIKSCFYDLSKKYHPDVNNSQEASTKFVEISTAYSVLSNDQKRKEYDMEIGRDTNFATGHGRSGFRYHSHANNINPDDWIQYKKSSYRPGSGAYSSYSSAYRTSGGPNSSGGTYSSYQEFSWTDTRTSWREYKEEKEANRAAEKSEEMKRTSTEIQQIRKKMMYRVMIMVIFLLVLPDILI